VDVVKAVCGMKNSNCRGPDEIPLIFLRKCIALLAGPLCKIFSVSLASGQVPSVWKVGHITPIFKGGSKHLPSNYRPITVTSVVCKVLEKIVRNHLVEFLEINDLLSLEQHGFLSGRSVTSNLLTCFNVWCKNFDRGIQSDIIYIDFSKAFDSVSHAKLIYKLGNIGIHPIVIKWLADFLSNGYQSVLIDETLSSLKPVLSGVPQGTVLGPLLFLLFCIDLPNCNTYSHLVIYADDCKIFKGISCVDDSVLLQSDLDNIVEWAHNWQLGINVQKTCTMTIGNRRIESVYCIDGTPLVSKECVLDLGVKVSNDLKNGLHCRFIVNKANAVCRQIHLCFKGHTPEFYSCLFSTYVRPILESSSVIWNPCQLGDIEICEKVQRRFSKFVPGLYHLSYGERLEAMGLEPLELRRLYIDLANVFKLLNGGYETCSFDEFFTLNILNTRGNGKKVFKPHNRTNVLKYFWSHRIVSAWNGLDFDTVNSSSLSVFKSNLYKRRNTLTRYCRGKAFM